MRRDRQPGLVDHLCRHYNLVLHPALSQTSTQGQADSGPDVPWLYNSAVVIGPAFLFLEAWWLSQHESFVPIHGIGRHLNPEDIHPHLALSI